MSLCFVFVQHILFQLVFFPSIRTMLVNNLFFQKYFFIECTILTLLNPAFSKKLTSSEFL